jgi:hypothetical protein
MKRYLPSSDSKWHIDGLQTGTELDYNWNAAGLQLEQSWIVTGTELDYNWKKARS